MLNTYNVDNSTIIFTVAYVTYGLLLSFSAQAELLAGDKSHCAESPTNCAYKKNASNSPNKAANETAKKSSKNTVYSDAIVNKPQRYYSHPKHYTKKITPYPARQFMQKNDASAVEHDTFSTNSTDDLYQLKIYSNDEIQRNSQSYNAYKRQPINAQSLNQPALNQPYSSAITRATVTLNGVEVISQDDLNWRVKGINKTVRLLAENTLSVEVLGKKNSSVIVEVSGVQTDTSLISVGVTATGSTTERRNAAEILPPVNILLLPE